MDSGDGARETGIVLGTYFRGKLKVVPEHRLPVLTVLVDREKRKVRLGEHFIAAPPGSHTVTTYVGPTRRSTIVVEVPTTGVVKIRWDCPKRAWQKPSMSVQP